MISNNCFDPNESGLHLKFKFHNGQVNKYVLLLVDEFYCNWIKYNTIRTFPINIVLFFSSEKM